MLAAHDCVRIQAGNGAIKPKPHKAKQQVNADGGIQVRIRDEVRVCEIRERPTAVRLKYAANSPNLLAAKTGCGQNLSAIPKIKIPATSNTDGHAQSFICDNRIVDNMTGMNTSPARTSRRTSP